MKQGFSGVKNLIFDFGGVIYEISHQKQFKAYAGLGIGNFFKLYSQAKQSPLFVDLECGKISESEFRSELRKIIGLKINDQDMDRTWNSILVGFPIENVRFLENLKTRYNLYLLSNTNSIHYNVYIKEFEKAFAYDFNSLFQETFWSFKVGMRKPEPEIYRHIMTSQNLSKEDTLFIDDTQINVTAAANAGMPAYWLKPGVGLSQLFDTELNLKL